MLDSTVEASVQSGLYQRNPDTVVPLINPPYDNNTYQPYNQVPLPSSLIIGTSIQINADFVVGNVTIAPEFVLPTLVNANGTPFNPLTDDPASDPLPAGYTASVLRPQLLGAQGFGNVSIYANGKFLDPASVALHFRRQLQRHGERDRSRGSDRDPGRQHHGAGGAHPDLGGRAGRILRADLGAPGRAHHGRRVGQR